MFDIDKIRQAPPPTVADALGYPNQVVREMATLPPGPDTTAALAVLDPAELSHAGRVDLLIALERQAAWLAGMQQRVLATMSRDSAAAADELDRSGRGWVREDVSCALRLSGITAERRLAAAETLVSRLRATLRLLESGAISYLHALHLAEAVYGLNDGEAATVEARALRRAADQTLAQFKATVRRAVASAHPERIEQQREQAMAERRVCASPRDDGMTEVWSLLPSEGAAALLAAVDALASVTSADDARTADQRRADALVDIAVGVLHDPLLPRAQGLRPHVQVTVALSTLLGCDDEPGDLDGFGPIPASIARRLAADPTGVWRRLVTDPLTGSLLEYGRTTYRPPRDLVEHVIARDRTCAFSTCNRAAPPMRT